MKSALLHKAGYLLWKAQCRLNRPLIAPWQAEGQGDAVANAWALASARLGPQRPDLCVLISSHKRPEACAELLQQLQAALPAPLRDRTQVIVLEDQSESDYAAVAHQGRALFADRFLLLRSQRWLGKPGYHLTYQAAFVLIRKLQPAHTLFIQDDLSLAPDFFIRTFALWGSIRDPKRAVLSLASFEDDELRGRWTRFKRRELLSGTLRKTQWFDLQAYLVDRCFFETLKYRVFPSEPLRFEQRTGISSGVGEQLTRRLWRRVNIYQVAETLVFHGAHASVMNADARSDRPLDNREPTQQKKAAAG